MRAKVTREARFLLIINKKNVTYKGNLSKSRPRRKREKRPISAYLQIEIILIFRSFLGLFFAFLGKSSKEIIAYGRQQLLQ